MSKKLKYKSSTQQFYVSSDIHDTENPLSVSSQPERSTQRMSMFKMFMLANTELGLKKTQKEIIDKITELESSCYNKCIDLCMERGINKTWSKQDFVSIYSSCCYKILYHLEASECTSVGEDSVQNEKQNRIKLYNLLFDAKGDLATLDLCPEATFKEQKDFELQSEIKLEEKVGTFVVCVKNGCGSREITWTKYQGRCADEQENYSYKCIKCNHQWHT